MSFTKSIAITVVATLVVAGPLALAAPTDAPANDVQSINRQLNRVAANAPARAANLTSAVAGDATGCVPAPTPDPNCFGGHVGNATDDAQTIVNKQITPGHLGDVTAGDLLNFTDTATGLQEDAQKFAYGVATNGGGSIYGAATAIGDVARKAAQDNITWAVNQKDPIISAAENAGTIVGNVSSAVKGFVAGTYTRQLAEGNRTIDRAYLTASGIYADRAAFLNSVYGDERALIDDIVFGSDGDVCRVFGIVEAIGDDLGACPADTTNPLPATGPAPGAFPVSNPRGTVTGFAPNVGALLP